MSSPGGGQSKVNLDTFNNLQTTPKILFIIALTLSILGLIGAIVGATSVQSGGGKAVSGLVGGGLCAGAGYWAYSIITDKKNLKTCNTSFWNVNSVYKYAKPTRDPDAKNISLCDAQKKAEYDNEEYKWFLTRPNETVSSNVDVWFFTDKTVSVSCPGDCTLYTANSTTTKRKSDAPTNTGCSGGGQRSPGSGVAGGSGAGGGGGGGGGGGANGACAGTGNPFSKGTASNCPAGTPSCHDGQRGSCCSENANCGNSITGAGVQLTCNARPDTVKFCCDPGTIWVPGVGSGGAGQCIAPANGTSCLTNADCAVAGNSANTCIGASGSTPGKCCLPGDVLNASGGCSAGVDGATCTTASQCTGGRECVSATGGTQKCCPARPAGAVTGYTWDDTGSLTGGKCLAPSGSQMRAQGDKCSASLDCASNACLNNRCAAACTGTNRFVGVCNSCVPGNEGACCGVNADCFNTSASGGECRKDDTPGSATGICCPPGKEKFGTSCLDATNRSNGTGCLDNGDCSSGNCRDGICRPVGYCEDDDQCGDNYCVSNRCVMCRGDDDCDACETCGGGSCNYQAWMCSGS